MDRAKAFFYISAGLFLLALSYHLGARSAGAQAPGNPIVTDWGGYLVTANGDVYAPTGNACPGPFGLCGNVFSGGPVSTQRESFGALKSRYRAPRAAQQAPQER